MSSMDAREPKQARCTRWIPLPYIHRGQLGRRCDVRTDGIPFPSAPQTLLVWKGCHPAASAAFPREQLQRRVGGILKVFPPGENKMRRSFVGVQLRSKF